MKFFLDENFPRAALTYLVSAGHSASHTLDHFPPGTADEKLFARAQSDGAIFITLRKPNRADLIRRLADALTLLGERDLRDTVWLVTDTRIRSRHAEIKK
jgi:hypothetical protein